MGETRHTPGPWRVCGGYTPEYAAVHSEAGYIVHGMADRAKADNTGRDIAAPDYETQRANIRLIAAAPELYDACTKLLPLVVEAIMHGMPITPEVALARNVAVAAIAKASPSP